MSGRRRDGASGFVYHRVSALPRLAWCAILDTAPCVARVFHGNSVDVEHNSFSEGVHDHDSLTPGAAVRSPFCLATGGYFDGQDFIFFTPSHSLDCIYGMRAEDQLILSNSLPFLLSASGADLDTAYIHYRRDFENISLGQHHTPSSRAPIMVFYGTNIRVREDLAPMLQPKPEPAPFETYSEYISQIGESLKRIALVAQAPSRAATFVPLATVSSGYDSPAAAVFAKTVGATEAVTITDAREDGSRNRDDSGEDIAKRLDFVVHKINRLDYRRYGIEAERVFYFRSEPEDIVFFPFKDLFAGKLLFTGVHGDTAWNCWGPAVGLQRKDNVGCSMQEFRIRTGFVHVPVAFYGWQHHERLVAIGRSEDMAAWRLGNTYDRPIARRIIEESGIPRGCFARAKKAVTVVPTAESESLIASGELTEALNRNFREIMSPGTRSRLLGANLCHLGYSVARLAGNRLVAGIGARGNREVLAASAMATRARKYSKRFGKFTFAAHWSNSELKKDYELPRSRGLASLRRPQSL